MVCADWGAPQSRPTAPSYPSPGLPAPQLCRCPSSPSRVLPQGSPTLGTTLEASAQGATYSRGFPSSHLSASFPRAPEGSRGMVGNGTAGGFPFPMGVGLGAGRPGIAEEAVIDTPGGAQTCKLLSQPPALLPILPRMELGGAQTPWGSQTLHGVRAAPQGWGWGLDPSGLVHAPPALPTYPASWRRAANQGCCRREAAPPSGAERRF